MTRLFIILLCLAKICLRAAFVACCLDIWSGIPSSEFTAMLGYHTKAHPIDRSSFSTFSEKL